MSKEKDHSIAASEFLKDGKRARWHDETLWFVREKRDKAAHTIPDWENLREAASQIKAHTLSKLDDYLLQFEAKAKKNGVHVHWAEDGEEHNTFCEGSAQDRLNENLRRCARIAADRFRSSHTDQTYTDSGAGCGERDVYVTGNFS